MEVSFDTRELRDSCSEDLSTHYGTNAEALMARLADLEAATNLAELPVGVDLTDISLQRVVIGVSTTCRMICRADRSTLRITGSGDPDWSRVNRLYIASIEIDEEQP